MDLAFEQQLYEALLAVRTFENALVLVRVGSNK